METQIRIAGIGEILMDLFEDGTATVGGAPLNVAFHAHQLLTASNQGCGEVVSAVGQDPWGEHILQWLRDAAISAGYIALDPLHPTGIAVVSVHAGDAGFEIAAEAAWDYLANDPARIDLARRCSAVAFGSLAQRSQVSGCAIRAFAAAVDGPRLYDVNLRTNTTDGARGFSPDILRRSCEVATIVKANVGELDDVAHMLGLPAVATCGEARVWRQMQHLLDTYTLSAVVITRGGSGAMLLGHDSRIQLPDSTLAVADVHPVGAGDAFSAGLLYGLCLGCTLAASAGIADRLASWVTRFASATPPITAEVLAELRALEAF